MLNFVMGHNIRLLTKIATLRYKMGLNQQQIADRLGMSRQTVGRYLQSAHQDGVVEITIRSPLMHCSELETELESAFNLVEAIVISPPTNTEESVKDALGIAGAEFVERRVQEGDTISVSWSTTVLACAEHLQPVSCDNITVVQMNGSMDQAAFSTRAEYIVDRIAQALNAEQTTLTVPLLVDRADILESLLTDSRISAALEQAREADFAIFGVGDITKESSLYKASYMDDELLIRLQEAGAVGDICGRYFNAAGEICLPDVDERTLAIELPNLRQKRLAVAIAGMPHKTQAILGMLKGNCCNVLITDEETAISVLDGR